MKSSLEKYIANNPDLRSPIFDLSQTQKYSRKTLKNGEMPCLATSSTYLWSQDLDRCFTGKEKLKTLMYPVEKFDFSGYSENTLSRWAGNGMFLPNVGWAMLAHILCAPLKAH